MLMCNETITLLRCDGVNYTQTTIERCSWFDKVTSSMGDKSQIPSREVKVRIPANNVPTMFPKIGDIVIRGAISTTVTKMSDIKDMNYARVMTVSDNRRGGLPHIGLTCQ